MHIKKIIQKPKFNTHRKKSERKSERDKRERLFINRWRKKKKEIVKFEKKFKKLITNQIWKQSKRLSTYKMSSISAQGVVERASVELAKRINGKRHFFFWCFCIYEGFCMIYLLLFFFSYSSQNIWLILFRHLTIVCFSHFIFLNWTWNLWFVMNQNWLPLLSNSCRFAFETSSRTR